MIDLHAHILPGIDDGAVDMDAALAMCAAGVADGIVQVAATAHLYDKGKLVTVADVERQLARLRDALKQRGLSLRVSAATETPIIEDIIERIAQKQVLPLDSGGRYILLESPHMGTLGDALIETIVRLRSCGITPVVAHPEASEAFRDDPGLARESVQRGAVMQVTASALASAVKSGRDGTISRLLDGGLIHLAASDAHDPKRRPLRLSDAYRCCSEELGDSYSKLLFVVNPGRILAGKAVLQARSAGRRASAGRLVSRRINVWYQRLLCSVGQQRDGR